MFCLKSSSIGSVIISGALFFVIFNAVSAGPIKSVDEQGNVTYSDKPVLGASEVSKVPIIPGPSEAEVDAAQQQADKNINAAKKVDQKNKIAQEKRKAEQAKAKAASDSKQPDTGITTNTGSGNYNGYDPYYSRPRPPINRPRPPGNKPRPPGTRPPVNLPAPRPSPRSGGR
jgi:hypothetical protein